jgi:hypothetical protein
MHLFMVFLSSASLQLPKDSLNGVARFLEAKGHVREALDVATDPDYRYVYTGEAKLMTSGQCC